MPLLLVKHHHGAPDVHPLRHIRLTIGRSARNDICVPDPFASRIHAEVRHENDEYVLRDLDSANGTFYNEARISKPVALAFGVAVRIGETVLELRDDNRTQTLSAAPAAHAQPTTSTLLDPVATTVIDTAKSRTTSGLLDAIKDARQIKPLHDVRTADEGERSQSDLLALISKVGVTLLASATLDETLAQIAMLVFDAVPAERCLIMLRRREELNPAETRAATPTPEEILATLEIHTAVRRTGEAENVNVSRAIIEEVILNGRSVLTSDAQSDPLFRGSTSIMQGIRAVLAVPLGVGQEVFGLVYADSPFAAKTPGNRLIFTETHLKVLTTLASVAAIRVQNARLIEEHIERERLERELYLAREIQQRFQPLAPPVVEGFDLLGISFSCYEIGGDYYDFIRCPNNRLVVALGDVSGKGTSAALLMSSLHAAIHAQVASQCSPVDTVRAVNRYLAANIPANRFVTLFYAELNQDNGEITFANAGHNPPLIVRASGGADYLDAGGLPLGILPDASFQEGRARLDHGDALIIYSDGVTETQNPDGEEFGAQRLQDVVARNLERTSAGIRDRIEAALTEFADGTAAADDITLVIVKRNMK
jgi:serine phosphatase RsbU (regulator of sigma subunit)